MSVPAPLLPVGSRVRRLVVLLDGLRGRDRSGRTYRRCRCRCDCGREVMVRSASLRTGASGSCGCLRRERSAAREAARPVASPPPP